MGVCTSFVIGGDFFRVLISLPIFRATLGLVGCYFSPIYKGCLFGIIKPVKLDFLVFFASLLRICCTCPARRLDTPCIFRFLSVFQILLSFFVGACSASDVVSGGWWCCSWGFSCLSYRGNWGFYAFFLVELFCISYKNTRFQINL